jgi:hypothetical protein
MSSTSTYRSDFEYQTIARVFIVRIHRLPWDRTESFPSVIEEVGVCRERQFKSLADLREILAKERKEGEQRKAYESTGVPDTKKEACHEKEHDGFVIGGNHGFSLQSCLG